MKKNFIFITLAASCVIFFASCAMVNKTATATMRNVEGAGILSLPSVATLDISQTKVTELYTIKMKGGNFSFSNGAVKEKNKLFIQSGGSMDAVKVHAVSKLLAKHNADVLIEPQFTFEMISSNGGSTYNVVVSGYPASYKEFRPATKEDIEILQMNPILISPERTIGTIGVE